MKTEKHKCGCVSELAREAWVTLCPPHEAEFQTIHTRWAEEHVKGVRGPMPIPIPAPRVIKGFGKGTVVSDKPKAL